MSVESSPPEKSTPNFSPAGILLFMLARISSSNSDLNFAISPLSSGLVEKKARCSNFNLSPFISYRNTVLGSSKIACGKPIASSIFRSDANANPSACTNQSGFMPSMSRAMSTSSSSTRHRAKAKTPSKLFSISVPSISALLSR